tara:strand:- start:418 stop:1011 length:594 start_codon:yes stop_codon:yes gene_type:complete
MNQLISYPQGVLLGVMVPHVLRKFGFRIGKRGVRYYAEVHTSALNSYCHSLGMPFFTYGILVVLAMLAGETKVDAQYTQDVLYSSYMTHYFIVDPQVGAVTAMIYSVPYITARSAVEDFYGEEKKSLRERMTSSLIKEGGSIALGSLMIQEYVGHYIGGDPPSRIEAIPNAILYAIYFSISHMNLPEIDMTQELGCI